MSRRDFLSATTLRCRCPVVERFCVTLAWRSCEAVICSVAPASGAAGEDLAVSRLFGVRAPLCPTCCADHFAARSAADAVRSHVCSHFGGKLTAQQAAYSRPARRNRVPDSAVCIPLVSCMLEFTAGFGIVIVNASFSDSCYFQHFTRRSFHLFSRAGLSFLFFHEI
jgi:hypothetical protein